MMRSRSCWYAGLTSSSRSGLRRPLVSALLAACGARVSRSRCSSPSRMVDNDVLQEAGAVGERADAEVGRERLPEVRKGLARPDIHALPYVRSAFRRSVGSGFGRTNWIGGPTGDQDGYILARMIGTWRARIVAVVCGHDEEIRIAQRRQEPRERLIDPLQVRGIAGHIVAMAVDRIAVHEVDEDEPVPRLAHRVAEPLHAFGVAGGVRRARDAAPREQVVDLADGHDRHALSRQQVEQRLRNRLERVIVAIRGPFERPWRADKGPRDDAADAHAAADQIERDLADAVLLRDGDDVLVRGTLKDAVGRRVDNRLARPDVLRPKSIDDLSARGHDVAERGASDAPLELRDEIGRKTARKGRKWPIE